MKPRTTGEFVRQYLPWVIIICVALGWGLRLFEQHVREDQHEQDMDMFRDWVTTHIDQIPDTTTKKK